MQKLGLNRQQAQASLHYHTDNKEIKIKKRHQELAFPSLAPPNILPPESHINKITPPGPQQFIKIQFKKVQSRFEVCHHCVQFKSVFSLVQHTKMSQGFQSQTSLHSQC